MNLLPPLIQIFGSPRYDLPACQINIDSINWSKYKTKLNLTDKETEKLYKLVKAKLLVNVKEIEGKNGILLKFSKKIDDKSFNDLMREFINDFKMCPKCATPELSDGSCNACGNKTDVYKEDKSKDINVTEKNKLLSKAEKQLLKEEKAQLEKEEKEKKKPNRRKNKEYVELDDTPTKD
jgi:hypothetical protein